MSLQLAFDTPKSEWLPPTELPNIFDAKQIAIDVETRDPNIKTLGAGGPQGTVKSWLCHCRQRLVRLHTNPSQVWR